MEKSVEVDDNQSNLESSLGESLRRDIKQVLVQDEFSSVKAIENSKYESENQEIQDLLASKMSKQTLDSELDNNLLNSHID